MDGKLLRGPERHVYLILNKPKGYVTTVTDPEGRPTVMNLVRGVGARVYPVGRLDYLSEGLLLMTNDGALVERLMHASTKVPKTYLVKVSGIPSEEAIEKLRTRDRAACALEAEPPRQGQASGGYAKQREAERA